MGYTFGFDYAGAFEVDLVSFEVGEQSDARPEENRHEVQMDLVEKAGLHAIACTGIPS